MTENLLFRNVFDVRMFKKATFNLLPSYFVNTFVVVRGHKLEGRPRVGGPALQHSCQ